MAMNALTAETLISDLDRKRGQIDEKEASILAEFILDRIQNNTLSRNTEKDIKNLIQNSNINIQVEILIKALVLVGMNNKTSRAIENNRQGSSNPKKIKNRSDIFGRYDD